MLLRTFPTRRYGSARVAQWAEPSNASTIVENEFFGFPAVAVSVVGAPSESLQAPSQTAAFAPAVAPPGGSEERSPVLSASLSAVVAQLPIAFREERAGAEIPSALVSSLAPIGQREERSTSTAWFRTAGVVLPFEGREGLASSASAVVLAAAASPSRAEERVAGSSSAISFSAPQPLARAEERVSSASAAEALGSIAPLAKAEDRALAFASQTVATAQASAPPAEEDRIRALLALGPISAVVPSGGGEALSSVLASASLLALPPWATAEQLDLASSLSSSLSHDERSAPREETARPSSAAASAPVLSSPASSSERCVESTFSLGAISVSAFFAPSEERGRPVIVLQAANVLAVLVEGGSAEERSVASTSTFAMGSPLVAYPARSEERPASASASTTVGALAHPARGEALGSSLASALLVLADLPLSRREETSASVVVLGSGTVAISMTGGAAEEERSTPSSLAALAAILSSPAQAEERALFLSAARGAYLGLAVGRSEESGSFLVSEAVGGVVEVAMPWARAEESWSFVVFARPMAAARVWLTFAPLATVEIVVEPAAAVALTAEPAALVEILAEPGASVLVSVEGSVVVDLEVEE